MAATSPEAIARKHIAYAVKALRGHVLGEAFDLPAYEGLIYAEKSLEWLEESKYAKSSYLARG